MSENSSWSKTIYAPKKLVSRPENLNEEGKFIINGSSNILPEYWTMVNRETQMGRLGYFAGLSDNNDQIVILHAFDMNFEEKTKIKNNIEKIKAKLEVEIIEFQKSSNSNNNKVGSQTKMNFEKMFEVIRELGSGTFGIVYEVEDKSTGEPFAVKKIKIESSDSVNSKNLEKYTREVKILAKCNCENIVQYFDYWIENNNYLYIQTELCSDNLRNIIVNKPGFFGRTSSDVPMKVIEFFISCQLLEELLNGVQYLHESNPKIIHRDLKPENILISYQRINGNFLKICDFGLSIFDGFTTVYHTRNKGTFKYMAPEVPGGKYNGKADIYSLGMVIQDLFNYDINGPGNIANTDNLRDKWKQLRKIIALMINPIYKDRPSSAQILSKIDDISIDIDELMSALRIEHSKMNMTNYGEFFVKYYNDRFKRLIKSDHELSSKDLRKYRFRKFNSGARLIYEFEN